MKRILISGCCLLLMQWTVVAQNKGMTSEDVANITSAIQPVLSPDGSHIAYTIASPRPFTEKAGGSYKDLYVLNVKEGTTKKYITNDKKYYSVGWTPDGKKLTFLGKWYDVKSTQLYTMELGTDTAIQVTDTKLSIQSYQWNPKKNSIAFVSTPKDTSRKHLVKKGFNAEIYEEGIPHKNLYVYDLSTKETKQVTKDITIYDMAWNPDGSLLAIQSATKNLTDYSYVFKKIQVVNPATEKVALFVNNDSKLGNMSWSPDGKNLAFISGVNINDPVNGSLFVANIEKKENFSDMTNIVEGLNGSVTHVEWLNENTLVYAADESVDATLTSWNMKSGKKETIIAGGQVVFSSFECTENLITFSGTTPQHPNEIFTYSTKNKKLVKHTENNPWLKERGLAKQEKMSYQSRDGITVEGVLMYPLNFEEGKTYPMINYIHGGPESCVKNGWTTYYSMWGQVAAAKGFFVFMPNYRGSSGRGVAFSKMDQGDMGDEEFNDVLDAIDLLIQKGYVDKSRVGIGGGSYGGYFSGWAATKHSERFAASVVFVGISNQISKRFTTDIPYESYYSHWLFWTHENFELVFDRSPVKYATNNQTPTLILHGKEDPRVHPSQALELYRSIKLHGKAPVRLVWYPGEGHGNRKNTSRLDYNLRTLEWFEYYLNSDNPKDKMPNKDLNYGVKLK